MAHFTRAQYCFSQIAMHEWENYKQQWLTTKAVFVLMSLSLVSILHENVDLRSAKTCGYACLVLVRAFATVLSLFVLCSRTSYAQACGVCSCSGPLLWFVITPPTTALACILQRSWLFV